MWVDAMTLSSKADNPEGAYAFMNYILDAQIGAYLARSVNFASPNKASSKYLNEQFKKNHVAVRHSEGRKLYVGNEQFKKNRVINPTKEEIDRMVFLRDLGDASKLFDAAWTTVKTH